MLQTDRLATRLHSALVVTLAGPRKARLEQVVADQRQEALGELPLHSALDRRRQIVVDQPRRYQPNS